MMKPCGLLSLLTASSRRQRVTRLRSVTELSRRMICRANVRTLYGYVQKKPIDGLKKQVNAPRTNDSALKKNGSAPRMNDSVRNGMPRC